MEQSEPPRSEGAGHRTVPHTADIRIEAWAGDREQCVAEAVLATVESFLDISAAQPTAVYEWQSTATSHDDLLRAVLDEIIYLLETTGEVPIHADLEPLDGQVDVRFAMTAADGLAQVGAVPKAVSLHELTLATDAKGWFCTATLDV